MNRLIPCLILLGLAPQALQVSDRTWREERPEPPALKEEKLTLEYAATSGEAVVIFQAESEMPLGAVEVCDPSGRPVLNLQALAGEDVSLQGFVVETRETSPQTLLASYGEGTYEMFARTKDGAPARGRARLSHDLLPPPVILHPADGAVDVSPRVKVRWMPDPLATGYVVVVEQGEDDSMVVKLPPTARSFRVPDNVLERGKESHVEVGVVGANGNCTLVEHTFYTKY